MRSLVAISLLLAWASGGCGQKVLFVPQGRPVRLGEPVTVKVWVKDEHGTWTLSQNRMTIPAGWDAFPPPVR